MGVDISWTFQARQHGQWMDIPVGYKGDRDGYLYGWLGIGGERICNPRGFPLDFVVNMNTYCHPLENIDLFPLDMRHNVSNDQHGTYVFMGEWGHSWLSGEEIIEARAPVRRMTIWIPIDIYKEWDQRSYPKVWHELRTDWQEQEYADRYARPENMTDETWWVIVDFEYDFSEHFKYFVDEVRRLVATYSEVRFVFGFG
jgi:hypothetical protein